jgi:hypothetical protein
MSKNPGIIIPGIAAGQTGLAPSAGSLEKPGRRTILSLAAPVLGGHYLDKSQGGDIMHYQFWFS